MLLSYLQPAVSFPGGLRRVQKIGKALSRCEGLCKTSHQFIIIHILNNYSGKIIHIANLEVLVMFRSHPVTKQTKTILLS